MALLSPSLPAPGAARLAAGTAASLVVAAAAGALWLFSADIAIGGGLLERAAVPARMLALVLLATLLLRIGGERWADLGLRRPRSIWRSALLVLGGYVAIGAAAAALMLFVLPALGLTQNTHAVFAALEGNLGEYLYWLLPVAWGSAAIGEELVFRGFVQSRLERLFGAGLGAALLAVVAQSAIFGALHLYQGAGGALLAGSTGFVIGLVYLLGGRNLWACIVLHGLIDTISLTALYLGAVPAAA
jgi:uncharacterized protein